MRERLIYFGMLVVVLIAAYILWSFERSDYVRAEICPAPVTCPAPDTGNSVELELANSDKTDFASCTKTTDFQDCLSMKRIFCKMGCIKVDESGTPSVDYALGDEFAKCYDACDADYIAYRDMGTTPDKEVLKDIVDIVQEDQGVDSEEDPSDGLGSPFTYKGKKCWRTYVEDSINDCKVCVGDVWEQVTMDDYYAELNADPFKPQVKPLKAKILEIRGGWVRFKRIDGDPANKNRTTMTISDALCVQFSKLEK